MAYKFHELATELKLRKKLDEFKTVALVLRGQDVQGQLDKIYDRQKMKFRTEVVSGLDSVDYEATPHALFLTNPDTTKPLIDFFLQSQYIKLYQDLKENWGHLSNLVRFGEQIVSVSGDGDGKTIHSSKIAKVTTVDGLLDQSYQLPASLTGSLTSDQSSNICSGVCVIKPNQPINVVMRTLKSIANMNPEGLAYTEPGFVQITNIESVAGYSQEQSDLLFEHDIGFDPSSPESTKLQFKERHDELFEGQPAIQLVVHGHNALGKLKALVGPANQARRGRNRHSGGDKDQLRSFYGVDRVDNAFFVSESVDEVKAEESTLFKRSYRDSGRQINPIKDSEKSGAKASARAPIGQMLLQGQMELALIVISPALVKSNDFVYVLDDFYRAKFNLCALKKRALSSPDLKDLFGDLAPKVHSLAVLEKEFLRGESVLMVFEKAKAIESAQSLIGKFGIKVTSDYEVKKISKKAAGMMNASKLGMGGGAADDSALMREYGSYIFCFPNAELNQRKIAKEFTDLPFSKHFTIRSSS